MTEASNEYFVKLKLLDVLRIEILDEHQAIRSLCVL